MATHLRSLSRRLIGSHAPTWNGSLCSTILYSHQAKIVIPAVSQISSFSSLAIASNNSGRYCPQVLLPSVLDYRYLSTTVATETANVESLLAADKSPEPSPTTPQIIEAGDGRTFAAFDMRKHPKLKPSIVKRRLDRMKTYEGAEKNIRHSPWRMNLVCQFAAGLPLEEAIRQLEFCKKSKAPLVQKVLKRTSNLADIRDGLKPSQLEVAECFATKGRPLKRIKTMGRGRSGRMEHKHSHIRVVLREIDFKLKLYQASSIKQKKKWFMLQQQAELDAAEARAEREELERLERENAAKNTS